MRAKPGIESAKRPRIGAKLESKAQPEIEWGRSLGRGWLKSFENAYFKPACWRIVDAKIYSFPCRGSMYFPKKG